MSIFFIVILIFLCSNYCTSLSNPGLCPNHCNGHGFCDMYTDAKCDCFPGYTGADCSQRYCPSGTAWFDFPHANNSAHATRTECSNMGVCDRSTGICSCRSGFTGAACDRTLCAYTSTSEGGATYSSAKAICSGNGRCMSLREVSVYTDYYNYYAGNQPEYDDWDADMIYGCVCQPGWEGAACDLKSCPKGDDPITPGVNEIQLFDCACKNCVGGLYFIFQNERTAYIPFNAPAALIKYRLEQLDLVELIDVEFLQGTQMCSSTGSIVSFTFLLPVKHWSTLSVVTANGLWGDILAVRTGGQSSHLDRTIRSSARTREVAACSNRGSCDTSNGLCNCFDGYTSSDGMGKVGSRGDCGYLLHFNQSYPVGSGNKTHLLHTPCPFTNGKVCSGNGHCTNSTGMCICKEGYNGLDCSSISCGSTKMWFGIVGKNHVNTASCSNIGYCDGSIGVCTKCAGGYGNFGGSYCEKMICPQDTYYRDCSGNGTCMSMRQAANYGYNSYKELAHLRYDSAWDADMIYGCVCSRAISVDNQYFTDYNFLTGQRNLTVHSDGSFSLVEMTNLTISRFSRGPYAYAATDFKGYNCQQMLCPKGDHPFNRYGVTEIQQFTCRADTGFFFLTFRENTTVPIFVNSTIQELSHYLEQLYTISKVSVKIHNQENSSLPICTVFGNYSVHIEFMTEYGDLPLLIPHIRNLQLTHPSVSHGLIVNVTEVRRGTKDDLECSAMGICDENTGICNCFRGFLSSNGSLSAAGDRGDCAFNNHNYNLQS